MNARSHALILLSLAVLSGAAATPSRNVPAPHAYPVREVYSETQATLRPGAPERAVLQALGQPQRRPSPAVWLYNGYGVRDPDLARDHGCSILVVTLADHRVVDIKLVNRQAAQIIAAETAAGRAATYVLVGGEPPALAVR